MKKLLLFTLLGLLAIFSKAQYVDNGGFETWNSTNLFEYPTSWTTSNFEILWDTAYDVQNATRVSVNNPVSDALKLDVVENDGDTLWGWAMCEGQVYGDNMEYTGGFPVTDAPDTLFVQYTCDVTAGDTALIFVSFKKNGVVLGEGFIPIVGTKSTWETVGLEIGALGDTPDTAFIAIAAGNLDNSLPGSTITIDTMWFGGTSDVIPNSGFTQWENYGYEEPDSWVSFNSFTYILDSAVSVTKTSDSQSGDYAARIESIYMSFLNVIGAALGTGDDVANPESQYFDIDFKPTALTGYYKYTPVGDDSAAVYIRLRETDDDEITLELALHEAAAYTAFELPISIPDTFDLQDAIIGFTPSYANLSSGDGEIGSVLYIDDIDLVNPCDTFTPPVITSTLVACGPNTLDAGSGWDSYEWSTNETTQTIDITEDGTYSVTVINDESGCEFTDDIDVTLDICDATKDYISNNVDLKVYPNPSNGIFNVSVNTVDNVEIEVINIIGARVYSNEYPASENILLDLRTLPKGIYYMTVKFTGFEDIQKLVIR